MRTRHPGAARSAVAWLAVLSLVVACGGITEGGGGSDGPEETPGAGEQPPDRGDVETPASDPPQSVGGTPLGPCEPGFSPARHRDRSCDWLGDGLCYSTKIDACECICPRGGKQTTCYSGFFKGANQRTEVSCW